MMRDVEEIVLPGITHWQSPSFFAYFPSNSSGPSILGELLSAGLGIQGMHLGHQPRRDGARDPRPRLARRTCSAFPSTSSLRTEGGGVIQDTASSAVLCALLAARERATARPREPGGLPRRSRLLHLDPGALVDREGGEDRRDRTARTCASIEVDESFAMSAPALEERIRADRKAGLQPFFVTATVGTTSSNAIDPLPKIGPICRDNGLWLHVDAAMSGTAALCPELRHIQDGVEHADSYSFNPHKWMFTNFDCDCFWVRRRRMLIEALSILPEYLRNEATSSGAVIDYRDWHVPLGRRFRALKLWFVIRHYGVEGLRYHVRRHVELAKTSPPGSARIQASSSRLPCRSTSSHSGTAGAMT